MNLQRTGLLLFCIVGIYASYLTQGIVSETFATKKYGPEKERFRHLEALNGAQSAVCCVWAFVIWQIMRLAGQVQNSDAAGLGSYWLAGISNSVGPAFGMVALRNITYSAQVLVKSCKMVPVMIMGTIISKKRYSMLEYMCMTLVGVGVALFGRKSSHETARKLAQPNVPLGYSLCLVNLALDGYTNAVQDKINHRHPRNPPIAMMCCMNFWTTLYYAIYLFVLTRSGADLLAFCHTHPDALWDVGLFCVCGAVGQLFIFLTIKQFGSLVNTLVCTTRKFFNILLSVLWAGNPLLPMQWGAVGMVFAGLIASSLLKSFGKRHKKEGDKPKQA